MHSCSCFVLSQLLFRTAIALILVSQFLLSLADAISYEKPYNSALKIYFLAHTSLFLIKSDVLKFVTVQKTYLVSKGLLIGVFSSYFLAMICACGRVREKQSISQIVYYFKILDGYKEWYSSSLMLWLHLTLHALLIINFIPTPPVIECFGCKQLVSLSAKAALSAGCVYS